MNRGRVQAMWFVPKRICGYPGLFYSYNIQIPILGVVILWGPVIWLSEGCLRHPRYSRLHGRGQRLYTLQDEAPQGIPGNIGRNILARLPSDVHAQFSIHHPKGTVRLPKHDDRILGIPQGNRTAPDGFRRRKPGFRNPGKVDEPVLVLDLLPQFLPLRLGRLPFGIGHAGLLRLAGSRQGLQTGGGERSLVPSVESVSDLGSPDGFPGE